MLTNDIVTFEQLGPGVNDQGFIILTDSHTPKVTKEINMPFFLYLSIHALSMHLMLLNDLGSEESRKKLIMEQVIYLKQK